MSELTAAGLRRFKPYPEYRDSGVEWLGEIPGHWNVTRTKFAARLRSGHTPSRQHPEYWQNCTIPWFGLADVWQIRDGQTEYVTDTAEKISELGLANSAARLLPKGTVMLSRTASVGFSAIMAVDMATTQDFVNWVCGATLRPEYLLYVFRSMQHELPRLTMGSTHQTIYMPDVGRFSTPMPPIREQDRIVDFVREHAKKIDALVAKKERLIELLQEKRTTLIARAVTKGLHPNVPMKDSGVEWLGEIPAHWNVRRVRQSCSRVTDGAHISPDVSSSEFPFVSTVDISGGGIDFDGCLRTSAPSYAYMERTGCRPHRGDVLFSKDGTVGTTAIVRTDREFAVASSLVILSPDPDQVDSRWLDYWLNGVVIRDQVNLLLSGAALRRISVAKVGRLPLLLPPELNEQHAIAAFLDRETAKINGLIAKVHNAIARLKELRTALISAAVTGRIDVREEVA